MSESNHIVISRKDAHKWKIGKTCPKCKKGELRSCGEKGEGHRHHITCTKCKVCNY